MVSFATFGLVISASVFHATWNFIARKAKGNAGVFFWTLWFALALLLPIIISLPYANFISASYSDDPHQIINLPQSIICGCLSGTIHSGYYISLNFGYRVGDISVVYPVARGTGVVLTAIWSRFLLQENISAVGWVGILCVAIGVMLIGIPIKDLLNNLKTSYSSLSHKEENSDTTHVELQQFEDDVINEDEIELIEPSSPIVVGNQEKPIEKPKMIAINTNALLLALLVGVFISGYSTVDKWGVKSTNPIMYIFIQVLVSQMILTPYYCWEYHEELRASLRDFKGSILLVGPLQIVTYLAILYAFQFSNASYIVALREVSVVIGAILGFVFLKERFTVFRGVGILFILSGIICVKLA